MYTIQLHQLRFHAPVGVYEEEKKLGTPLLVDLSLSIEDHKPNESNQKAMLVDYSLVYEKVSNIMKKPCDLLETVAHELIEHLFAWHSGIHQVDISIAKIQPPIASFIGAVSVSVTKTRTNS